MSLAGKTVLLTGATGGIGQAFANALAAEGANLILVGRNSDKLAALAADLKARHATTTTVLCADLDSAEGRTAIAAQCHDQGVDILINNAGYQDFGLFEEQTGDVIERTLNINLLAPMLLIHELLPGIRSRGHGTIVNVGSIFGSIGHPAFVAYCASKFGLRGFTEALRRELADSGLRIHYLAPRATDTELNSAPVRTMNESLGTAMDSPQQVAAELIALLQQPTGCNRYIGWPEKLFVRINALIPAVVDGALKKQLATIRQFAGKTGA